MNCVISDLRTEGSKGGSVRQLPEKPTVDLLSLSFYLDSARRIIAKYANGVSPGLAGRMLGSEDAVADVATKIMLGEWKWRPNGGTKRSTFRIQNGRFAIQEYLRDRMNTLNVEHLSLDMTRDEKRLFSDGVSQEVHQKSENERAELTADYVHELIRVAALTATQRQCIKLRFFQGMKFEEVAKVLGVSVQAVHQATEGALRVLRSLVRKPD